jgi:hypothetical protein
MTQKEEAIAAARRYAERASKYSQFTSPYGPMDGNIISMVHYTSTPQIPFDRMILVCARSNKKAYLAKKGRINESQHWEASRIISRERVPGPHHIELVTVKLTRKP